MLIQSGQVVRLVAVVTDAEQQPGPLVIQPVDQDQPEEFEGPGPIRFNRKLGIKHTPNFRIVKWGREQFRFTHKQSLVIEALANAANQEQEWLDQATLLECADSDGSRLDHLFRGHPAWGRFIVRSISESLGAFKLEKSV